MAVLGAGRMGLRRAGVLRELPGVRIVGFSDTDPARAGAAARAHGTEVFGSAEALLRRPEVDLVLVCTPNRTHEALVIRALEAGKDAFTEKPLACDAEAAHRMVAAARRAGRSLGLGANTRWIPSVRAALAAVRGGALGRPRLFRGWIGHDGSRLTGDWYVRRAEAGGGTLIDNGVHLIDLARLTLGELAGCSARTARIAHPEWEVEDLATATFDAAGGGSAMVQSSWIDRSGYFYFEIHGDEGYLSVDATEGLRGGPAGRSASVVVPADDDLPNRSYRDEMTELLRRLGSDEAPDPNGEDGARLVAAVGAAYTSAAEGRHVAIP